MNSSQIQPKISAYRTIARMNLLLQPCTCTYLALICLFFSVPLTAQTAAANPCSAFANSSYPSATLSNGAVQAVVYLPDAKNGYYRASRFDWSGVIPCLTYKGHTYFGIWFQRYDPLIADAIAGPVEEFRSEDGGLNYAQAKPGESFVKIGVGLLRKVDDSSYRFMFTYPLIDGGKWTVRVRKSEIVFTQRLRTPLGIAYLYTKTLKLDSRKPILTLEHHLKNIGAKAIDTEVYEHDFFMLDNMPTGPGMVIHFPFPPKAEQSLEPGASIAGNDIVYRQELQPHQTVTSYLTGFSNRPADYDFTLENRQSGVGVEQSGTAPISRFDLWSIRTTICPEAYLHLSVAPGQSTSWDIRYRFFAP